MSACSIHEAAQGTSGGYITIIYDAVVFEHNLWQRALLTGLLYAAVQECADNAAYGGRLEATGPAVADWLTSRDAEGGLLPDLDSPAGMPPSTAQGHSAARSQGQVASSMSPHNVLPHDADLRWEVETEARCVKAFSAVRYFEDTHRLNLQVPA